MSWGCMWDDADVLSKQHAKLLVGASGDTVENSHCFWLLPARSGTYWEA